jgi:hypothetical protein
MGFRASSKARRYQGNARCEGAVPAKHPPFTSKHSDPLSWIQCSVSPLFETGH